MRAHLRQVRISSKKLNLVASMVRRMSVDKALQTLKFTDKKGADILHKLISSAKANAEHNFKQDGARLVIEEIIVNEGTTYKRSQPISRGRTHPILKRTAHVSVKLNVSDSLSPSGTPEKKDAHKIAKVEKSVKKAEVKKEAGKVKKLSK